MKKKEPSSYVFSLVKENVNPSIEGVKYPRSVLIPCIDEIYDEATGENRVIRYAAGERNIYLDEQTNQDMNKRAQITFINGHLIVDRRQKQLLEFLRLSNRNESNTDRMPGTKAVYKEYVPGEGASEAIEFDKLEIEAASAAYAMDMDDMIAYARVLGIDVNRDPKEIRYAMSVTAKRDPQEFLDGMNNPQTKRKHYMYQALDANIIVIKRQENSVWWVSSKRPIVQAPKGVDPLNHLVEYTFDPEGEKVYEHIRELLSPGGSAKEAKEEVSTDTESDIIGMGGEELLRMAKELGVVKTKPPGNIIFNEEKIEQGYVKAGVVVDENPTLKRQLIKAIENA